MPITQSAKKKMRQDIKRKAYNRVVRRRYKSTIKEFKKEKSGETDLSRLYRDLDLAAKKRVIHSNKAARLKSRLAKRIHSERDSQPKKKTAKERRAKKKKK